MKANGDEICPLCAAKNENGKLILFQVNLGQAIKLCSRKQVHYGSSINGVVFIGKVILGCCFVEFDSMTLMIPYGYGKVDLVVLGHI